MVSTLEELLRIKEMISEEQEKLHSAGINTDDEVQLGIMVEVPSVALQADLYARHADFLSIGTNDLTQYVLAVDRGNERISHLYDQRHPAIWKLLQDVADAAQKHNTGISICGELASNPIAACCLVGMGITDLSMNAVMLPSVKQMLRSHALSEMKQLSQQALESETIEDINNIFKNWKDNS
jgi:phosphotransferase system enzyme I (PtsI)